MKISGIASGIDTESIIRDMMKVSRAPLDRIVQKKAYTQWMLDDYRSTNRDLRNQSDKLFDTVMKQSTFMQKKVNVSDDKAVSIRSLNATSDFSGTLEVKHLATQARLQGTELTYEGKKLTDKQMKELKLSDLEVEGTDGKVSLSIKTADGEPKVLEFSVDDKLDDVLKKINRDGGVNAFYDSFTGKIAMTAKDTGAGGIEIGGDNELTEALGLTGPNVVKEGGKNAMFTFNGLETQRASNTFQINGFEITLKQETTSPVTFSSSVDTDKVLDAVVEFVNDYNEMIEKLNGKIKEKQFKSFHPLSAEEKEAMKEKEIELWEEKAKSGTMRNDPTISTMLNNLRGIMTKSVNTTDADGNPMKINLKEIGIETSKNYLDNGKLIINEDKLREKIAENPNAIYDLIGRDDGENSGIARAYRQELQDAQKQISEKAGSSTAVNDTFAIGRAMKNMDKQIERFEDKLKMMEARYWKQFTAMEKAMSQAQSQSASLFSSMGM